MIRILCPVPQLTNVNGDAENARVLAQRLRWSGIEAEVVDTVDDRPDAIVIGSSFDADMPVVLEHLISIAGLLRTSVSEGVPVLAVGTGMHLLGDRLQLDRSSWADGLGLLSGEAPLAGTRIVGPIVVDSAWGALVGYENHSRRWISTGAALGTVRAGTGNADSGRSEGAVAGSVVSTHLHGPVLARNPALADHMLGLITSITYDPSNSRAATVDLIAENLRTKALSEVSS